jgi:hypothetical protein
MSVTGGFLPNDAADASSSTGRLPLPPSGMSQ